MHYVITGSIGHTGKPITEGLVKAGHTVTVVTSRQTNVAAIEALGAKAAVGSIGDVDFLTQAFAGANAAYLLIPVSDDVTDWRAAQNEIVDNYIAAIKANDIRFVVLLSSIGADLGKGVGPVDGLYDAEQKLSQVDGLNSKFLRPSYFMSNFLGMIGLVKGFGIVGSNFGADGVLLSHTNDVAEAAVDELARLDFTGHQVRYLASDEQTGADIAKILGESVGKPETPWVIFSDEQNTDGLMQAGFSQEKAGKFTEMGEALRNGSMQADFFKNKPTYGKVKLEDFAKNEFAPAFGV